MKVKSRPKRVPRRPAAIKASLVRIGNSRGVRLPRALIEQAGLAKDVEITLDAGGIVIRPAAKKALRADWEERFDKSIKKYGPAEPMDPDWEYMPNDFDEKEWTW